MDMTFTATIFKDITVPEEEILRQAGGNNSAALRLAAVFGYELACRDLSEATLPTKEAI
jgi:hypothetical protein